jgi:hypothetical protein
MKKHEEGRKGRKKTNSLKTCIYIYIYIYIYVCVCVCVCACICIYIYRKKRKRDVRNCRRYGNTWKERYTLVGGRVETQSRCKQAPRLRPLVLMIGVA